MYVGALELRVARGLELCLTQRLQNFLIKEYTLIHSYYNCKVYPKP